MDDYVVRGERRAWYRDDKGHVHIIFASWTDIVDEEPLLILAAGRAYLRTDDMLRLAELLARRES